MDDHKLFYDTIAKAIALPEGFALFPETNISDVPGWDSFGWVTVITALEELSGRSFPIENIEHVGTLAELLTQFESIHRDTGE